MPRNLVYSFLHEVHCFTGNRLTCVWPMNQAMRQMGSEMRGDGVKYCMSGDTSTTPCEGWFFYNSCGYRSRGTPKTTFSSPFYTYYESSWGLRWNSPSIQCRERAGMNWGALLWRCVLQRSEVSPDETLGRWINVVSWAPAPWLRDAKHWWEHSSDPLQLTKADYHQITFKRSLCSGSGKHITWTYVCRQQPGRFAQCSASENLYGVFSQANWWVCEQSNALTVAYSAGLPVLHMSG